MADVNADEAEQKAEASFGEGFGVTHPTQVEKVVDETKTEPVADPAVAAPPVEKPAVVEKPRYAKVLQSDFDNLKAAAGKVSSLESQVARLTGTIGNTAQLEQRIVEKVKALTPAGLSVELSDDDFADLSAEFPELAKHTRAALEKVFKKAGVRGTGDAPAFKNEDLERVVEGALHKREFAALGESYPEWRTIVGAVNVAAGEKPPEDNEYRRWLAQQPEAYQQKINDTNSPAEVRSSIDKFMASKTVAPVASATPNRAAARRAIMEDAIAPRTNGGPPLMNQPLSADDAFEQGFRQTRVH